MGSPTSPGSAATPTSPAPQWDGLAALLDLDGTLVDTNY